MRPHQYAVLDDRRIFPLDGVEALDILHDFDDAAAVLQALWAGGNAEISAVEAQSVDLVRVELEILEHAGVHGAFDNFVGKEGLRQRFPLVGLVGVGMFVLAA